MQDNINIAGRATSRDKIAQTLQGISQNIFLVVFGILPIFFVPIAFAPFEYSKILLVIIGCMVSLIFFGLSVLRTGLLTFSRAKGLWLMWLIPLTALISTLLSGDVQDALIGDGFSTQSTLFLTLLVFVATATTIILQQKKSIMRFYVLLLGVAIVLSLYHVIRLVFGAETLSFGVFTSAVSTPLGGWNDLGLFFGLTIILSLVALEQLPLTKYGKMIILGIVGVSLLMLSVVNFSAVWMVLGMVSLIMVIYSLSKDRFNAATTFVPEEKSSSVALSVVSIIVFLVSFLFIIGGGAIGTMISNVTGVSYIEVRPSVSATADIARSVYADSAFTGIGPNKFVDAWRLYKDPSINQTVFWNTDFRTGSGYVTTQFVTTGVLGVLAWLVFFGMYIRTGARMLFTAQASDKLWFFIATSSFIASVYIWGMSVMYVPSAGMLLLGALFVGITYSVCGNLMNQTARTITFGVDRRSGFVLVTSIMIVIVSSVSIMYVSGRHYAGSYVFASGLANIDEGTTLEDVEQKISDAYNLSPSDVFARQVASYQIARMNALLTLTEPTPEQQQQFQNAVANGITSAQLAVDIDGSDAQNWAILGAVYSAIASAGIEGAYAYDRAKEAFTQARALAPQNPLFILNEAQLESRNSNLEGARSLAEEAIRLRPRYVEAAAFLAELDVAAGNLEGAIATTQALIQLEPQNPSRFYQLGILYISNNDMENAAVVLQRAVALSPDFANARYFLALTMAEMGNSEEALTQLRLVAETNPDNELIAGLIGQLESGQALPSLTGSANPSGQVAEPEVVSTNGEAVTSEVAPDSPLVSPLNPGGEPAPAAEVAVEDVINQNQTPEEPATE